MIFSVFINVYMSDIQKVLISSIACDVFKSCS